MKRLHPERHVRKKGKPRRQRKPGASLTSRRERKLEVWKNIPGFDGVYSVSSYGRVRRREGHSYKQLNLCGPRHNGWAVNLVCRGERCKRVVRSLIVEVFAPHLKGKHLKFKDGDPTNVTPGNIVEKKMTRNGNILTAREVAYIKRLLLDGTVTRVELAKKYKVSYRTIYDIYKGRTWKDIKPSDFTVCK
jgi:transposase